jgi:hypothetical protein
MCWHRSTDSASPLRLGLNSGITYHEGALQLNADGTWQSVVAESFYGPVIPLTDEIP